MKTQNPSMRLVTAEEVRRWPQMEGRYFLAVTDPENAARLFNRDRAYPQLVQALRALADVHRNDTFGIYADARALLSQLGEDA